MGCVRIYIYIPIQQCGSFAALVSPSVFFISTRLISFISTFEWPLLSTTLSFNTILLHQTAKLDLHIASLRSRLIIFTFRRLSGAAIVPLIGFFLVNLLEQIGKDDF
ncbi:hypothetical protein Y032_0740g1972 [Ancylostoma ceylanicum]|uniref:Uncharacterized protein n=1 Tax=Ancylostoma ceylanicum TaxID=53326 RepID=A0A016WET9_9BILA|nr:hypothetical protein Y032_0740g1972 [Ancylostoma ceylanicum]